MKKTLLSLVGLIVLGVVAFTAFNKQEVLSKNDKEIASIKSLHRDNFEKSPFKEVSKLSKKERKAQGLPPNKYLEREWELSMNPELGRPTPENLKAIKESMNSMRLEAMALRVSGDASDNNWVERGPNNVGGRTRALMFDPNDATNETVFAGGVSGGLWKNTNISNSNSTWTQVDISENLNVSSIAVDPNNSNIFYIGTGESYVGGDVNGNGVWKSTDGGTTWTKIFGGITGPTTFEAASVITVNSPAGIAGTYPCYPSTAFGPAIASVMTQDFVLADDGTAPNDDGCTAFVNGGAMAGKIALIRRGSCAFVVKVKAAQDAGAIGAIVMNNVPGTPVAMGGTDATITIPSVMISKEDGDTIVAALGSGVNGSLNPPSGDYTGNLVPGAQHINDIVVRDNGGASEVYLAAGAARYGASNSGTYMGADSYGLYKSVDAGTSWTELSMPLTAGGKKHTPNDIEIGADNKIWVATTSTLTTGDGGGKIFASTNAAATTFELKHTVTDGRRVQIAASAQNAGTLYVLAQVQSVNVTGDLVAPFLGMLKTTNSFASTSNMALPNGNTTDADDFTRGQAFYDLVIAVDPTNDQNLFVGGIDLFKSTNAGASWSQFTAWYGLTYQEVHSDHHAIVFGNGDVNKMLFGNDGGVYYSPNKGTNTDQRNTGYNTSQFYSVGVAPTSSGGDNFAGGLQDNGTQSFNNASAGINNSIESQGGDGAATDYDQDTGNYYISNYVYNDNINQRNLNGSLKKALNSESLSRGDFINQQTLDSNKNTLYTNYTDTSVPTYQIRRYRIPNFGSVNKTLLTDPLLQSGGSPTALKVSPFTTATTKLYVGTFFGDLLRVDGADGNSPTWTDIGTANFVGSISDVEFGATENDIFVTMHNYGVSSIWYTSDGGTNWAEKEGDLPDMPVKTILQNPLNAEEVVVGTELGVWYTNDFSSANPSWHPAFNGMSNVKVTDLDVRDDNAIYAATYGRGVFSGMFTAAPLLGVNDADLAVNTVKVYPTVSNGNVFVKSTVNYNDTKVMVYDLNGKLAYKTSLELYSNGEAKLNLTNLSSGMYFVNLASDELNKTVKIIKN